MTRMPTIKEAQRTLAIDDDVDEGRPVDAGRRRQVRRRKTKSPARLLAVDEDCDENTREEVQGKDAGGRRKPSGRWPSTRMKRNREREEPRARGTASKRNTERKFFLPREQEEERNTERKFFSTRA